MAGNTYTVTAPRPVLDYEPGSTFTHTFTAEEEADLLDAGRIRIEPSEYEVIGASYVFGTKPGGKFKAALTLPRKAHLIDGGFIEQVPEKKAASSATTSKEKK